MQILIATHNQTKFRRIQSIFDSLGSSVETLSLDGFATSEPDEPYNTFLENAVHKAQYYCAATGLATLSEDSGLCINALNDFPGVRTKEFRESCGSITAACETLQNKLIDTQDRSAYFISAACLIVPNLNITLTSQGRLYGTITAEPFQDHGFDFERIFVAEGFDTTLAETKAQDKTNISHRYKAIKSLYDQLTEAGLLKPKL